MLTETLLVSLWSKIISSVADPGCLSRIRIFPSRIRGQKDSGSRIRIKEFKYFNPKNCFKASENMIWDVHPGSGSWFFTHPGSRIQRSKRHRICNTDLYHNVGTVPVQFWFLNNYKGLRTTIIMESHELKVHGTLFTSVIRSSWKRAFTPHVLNLLLLTATKTMHSG